MRTSRKIPKPYLHQRSDTGAFYVIWSRDGKKRRHKAGKNPDEARLLLIEAELALARGEEPFTKTVPVSKTGTVLAVPEPKEDPKARVTLQEFLERFLEWSKATKSLATYRDDHKVRLERFVAVVGGDQRLAELDPEQIEGYKVQRFEQASVQTVWGDIKTIKAFLNKAVEWGYLQASPAKSVKKPKVPQRTPRALDRDEVEALLTAARGSKVFAAIALGIYAGLRKQEIEWLEWDDIDFEHKVIRVVPKEGWSTKNKRARGIPLHTALAEILSREVPRISRWIVCNNDGSRYTHNLLRDTKKAAVDAGLIEGVDGRGQPKTFVNLHLLRHTFASRLVTEGVSIFKVSQWLGHADVKTTMIYAHLGGGDEDIDRL